MKNLKRVFTLAAMLVAGIGAAHADTITLNPAGGFGALHQYHGVTTSAVPDDPVTMYLPQIPGGIGGIQLQFTSEQPANPYDPTSPSYHWTGGYAPGLPSGLVQYYCSGPLIDRGGFYSQDCVKTGAQMVLTITESYRRVCGGSGRGGGYCRYLWTLLGGTIVR